MTVGELTNILKQFDPNANVWIVYDCFDFGPPKFMPYDPIKDVLFSKEELDNIQPGDLVDWEG